MHSYTYTIHTYISFIHIYTNVHGYLCQGRSCPTPYYLQLPIISACHDCMHVRFCHPIFFYFFVRRRTCARNKNVFLILFYFVSANLMHSMFICHIFASSTHTNSHKHTNALTSKTVSGNSRIVPLISIPF